jgi:hypothetical protein
VPRKIFGHKREREREEGEKEGENMTQESGEMKIT